MRLKIKTGSHLPVLIRLVEITKGDVLELGTGYFSTPYLHWKCLIDKRNLVSYESEDSWHTIFKEYECEYHKVRLIKDWSKIKIQKEWDIALVDHVPSSRRVDEMIRLADYAKYIIAHDTDWKNEKHHSYKKRRVWEKFKYKYDYTEVWPWTSVVSNIVDVTKLKI